MSQKKNYLLNLGLATEACLQLLAEEAQRSRRSFTATAYRKRKLQASPVTPAGVALLRQVRRVA